MYFVVRILTGPQGGLGSIETGNNESHRNSLVDGLVSSHGALYADDLVVFENMNYGNAMHVLMTTGRMCPNGRVWSFCAAQRRSSTVLCTQMAGKIGSKTLIETELEKRD
jgi:hypothetical protein